MAKKPFSRGKGAVAIVPVLIAVLFIGGAFLAAVLNVPTTATAIKRFGSCQALNQEFQQAWAEAGRYYGGARALETLAMPMAAETRAGVEYSTTNIQVAGVDEADIVKTDGEYIYTLSGGKLVISRAYPPEQAGVLSRTDLGNLHPQEMFIHQGMLLIFGSTYQEPAFEPGVRAEIMPYPYPLSLTTLQLWDISDSANPQLARALDFEGSYVSSRKIGDYAYFVVNSYPRYEILEKGGGIVPLYRDRSGQEIEAETNVSFEPACACGEVGYFEPVNPQMFVTVASISLTDLDAGVIREVVAGSGQNTYASLENLYLAESSYPYWRAMAGEAPREKTIVHKFGLENGRISYKGNMEAPGRVLNQFSMDEYLGYFRIATTTGQVSRAGGGSGNNIYIFGEDLGMVGKLEDLAPGEQIYSARFMGGRGYLVTFKKIDPLFAIDLSVPSNPRVLGKLKIPGYSDYLHPYDENHLIGIGKEAVEADEGDFAWYQGVKMAIFDVSDVSNPRELHKVVIGDRGSDSDALHDHKAFLFDRERGLLVLPILLAEIDESRYPNGVPANAYGEFVYQGAYVYTLTLEDGFELRGRVTHYETEEPFQKAGHYFRGDYSVRRSLYIGQVLYTLSDMKLKLNSLADLAELGELVLSDGGGYPKPILE